MPVFESGPQLERSRRLLSSVLHCLVKHKPIQADELETVLTHTLQKTVEALGANLIAMVVLSKKDRVSLKYTCASSAVHENDEFQRKLIREQASGLDMDVQASQRCFGRAVIKSGEARIQNRASKESVCCQKLLQALEIPLQSLLAVPVLPDELPKYDEFAGRCILAINREGETGFTEHDREVLETVSYYVGKLLVRFYNPKVVLPEKELSVILAHLCRCEFIELGPEYPLDLSLLHAIGQSKLEQYDILPLEKFADNTLRVAMACPQDTSLISDFEICTGLRISEKVVATSTEIKAAFARAFCEQSRMMKVAAQLTQEYNSQLIGDTQHLVNEAELTADTNENSALIVNLGNRIIEDAYTQGASDIHVEPHEKKLMIRYRIDGVCREKLLLPKAAQASLVARLKIMSDLNIAEHRLPQDGRIVFKNFSRKFDLDLRVSVVPTQYGESVVMRILDKTKSTLPLDKLGFSPYNLALYRKLLNIPYGMILHTGPTGSGKSMTLYAALNEINSPEYKILTAEDPIEYTLPGIVQVHIRHDVGLTFAAALRCFLRQDPDIILVGEVRDRETAEIAVEAALTGHVLFSTLHTNDACSSITRLVDIGIEPFLISNTLACICAQRLVRRLCTCKTEAQLTQEEIGLINRARDDNPLRTVFKKNGCERCGGTGYKGRTGVHELLQMTDEIREMITRRANSEELKAVSRRNGMRTLFEDAMEKVKAGITSLPEALNTAQADENPAAPANTTPELAQKAG